MTCKTCCALVPRPVGICDIFGDSSGVGIYCGYPSSACQLIPVSPMPSTPLISWLALIVPRWEFNMFWKIHVDFDFTHQVAQ